MRRKVLVDTNILIDAAIPERPNHVSAMMLFDEVLYSQLDIYIAPTSLKDVYYVLSKYSSETEARLYVRALLDLLLLADINEVILKNAVCSNEPDFEDGIIRSCAETLKVDYIISRDETAFTGSHIKRIDAHDYLINICGAQEITL